MNWLNKIVVFRIIRDARASSFRQRCKIIPSSICPSWCNITWNQGTYSECILVQHFFKWVNIKNKMLLNQILMQWKFLETSSKKYKLALQVMVSRREEHFPEIFHPHTIHLIVKALTILKTPAPIYPFTKHVWQEQTIDNGENTHSVENVLQKQI